jgi:hypothetical protein
MPLDLLLGGYIKMKLMEPMDTHSAEALKQRIAVATEVTTPQMFECVWRLDISRITGGANAEFY